VTAGKRDLDALIEEITVDCYGEVEELTCFLTYLEDALEQPVEASVVGVPVTIVGVDCPAGALRACRQVPARRRRRRGVAVRRGAARGSELARVFAAYRYWAGVDPWPAEATRRRGAGGGPAARR
jgi:hypothetical protein